MSVIVVSWILVLLSVFGVTYSHEVRGEAELVELGVERQQLRAWSRSGVQLALAELDRVTRDPDSHGDWVAETKPRLAGTHQLGDGRFAVGEMAEVGGTGIWLPGLMDESGRLPAALADSTALARLPGMTPGGVHRLLRARRRSGAGRFPPIELISGLDEGSRRSAEQYLTRFGEAVNVNTAPLAVLVAAGLTERAAQRMIDWRDGSDRVAGTKDDQHFVNLESSDPGVAACRFNSEEAALLAYLVGGGHLTVGSRYFRLTSRAWGPRTRGICETRAVLEVPEEGAAQVIEWNENWLH